METFCEKIMKQTLDKMREDIRRRDEWEAKVYEEHLKELKDIREGKPVYFKGFANLITSPQQPSQQ